MNLRDAIIKIEDKKTIIPLPSGYSNDIDHFWDNVVKPVLPDKDRVITFFRCLKQYINDPDAIFAIRTGAAEKMLGLLTVIENTDPSTKAKWPKIKFVYADNDFATIVYKLIYDKYWDLDLKNQSFNVIYKQFKDAMISKYMPVRFRSGRQPQAAFKERRRSYFSDLGYKDSHLFNAGMCYGFAPNLSLNLTEALARCNLPLGNKNDWAMDPSEGCYIRSMKQDVSEETIKFLQAHFLRFICPLNHVMTPKKSCQQSGSVSFLKNDIGEEPFFLNYAIDKFKNMYGHEFDDFIDLIMLPIFSKTWSSTPGSQVVDITYGLNLHPQNGKISQSTGAKQMNQKTNVSIVSSSRKGKKYCVGKIYNQGQAVFELIKLFIDDNPNITYQDLCTFFDIVLASNKKPLIRLVSDLKPYELSRVFKTNFTLVDGNVIAVNNQIQYIDMPRIAKIAINLGYGIVPA